jgi:hypothetical protein
VPHLKVRAFHRFETERFEPALHIFQDFLKIKYCRFAVCATCMEIQEEIARAGKDLTTKRLWSNAKEQHYTDVT